MGQSDQEGSAKLGCVVMGPVMSTNFHSLSEHMLQGLTHSFHRRTEAHTQLFHKLVIYFRDLFYLALCLVHQCWARVFS